MDNYKNTVTIFKNIIENEDIEVIRCEKTFLYFETIFQNETSSNYENRFELFTLLIRYLELTNSVSIKNYNFVFYKISFYRIRIFKLFCCIASIISHFSDNVYCIDTDYFIDKCNSSFYPTHHNKNKVNFIDCNSNDNTIHLDIDSILISPTLLSFSSNINITNLTNTLCISFYCNNPTNNNYVSLTFDDGPHPIHTPILLDILKKYNAKASFCLLGKNIMLYPELAKRIYDEGHELLNHGPYFFF